MALQATKDIGLMSRESMIDYGSYVILARALPDYRDGLKPVHRAILWSMSELGLNSKARYVKGAKVVGDTMANYHPHGDSSIDDSLVRLSQPWVNNEVLTDIHGNNGHIDGSGAAAMRYYECRLSASADLLLNGIGKNAVNLLDNFDGTKKIPEVLPASIPQAFINGAQGIAFGMASNILPHNSLELLDGCIKIIKTPSITPEKLGKIVLGPDFPTGGVIVENADHMKEVVDGTGRFVLRGKVELHVEKKKESYLEITEVPWGVNTSDLKKSIATALEPHMKALGVTKLDDESKSSNEISIKILCKRGTDETTLKQIETLLYKKSKLQVAYTANTVMIVDGKPMQIGIYDYLHKFVDFRRDTLRRMWQYDLDKLQSREHIVRGLLQLVKLSDEVVKDARKSTSRKNFIEVLQKKHKFSEAQSEVIANLPLYRLGKQDFEQLTNELDENLTNQKELSKRLSDEDYCNQQLILDFQSSKQILKDSKRKTTFKDISDEVEVVELKEEDLIESKATKVVVKRDLQVFRIGAKAYENNIASYDNDDIVDVIDSTTTDYIVVATKSGQSVTRFVNDLDNGSLTGSYETLNKQIPDLKATDEFVGVSTSSQYETSRMLVITKNGAAKLLDVSKAQQNVNTKRYLSKLGKLMKFKSDDDYVIYAKQIDMSEFKDTTIKITMLDSSFKTPKMVEKKINMSKYDGRSDGASSTGFTLVNTKNGKCDIKSIELEK